MVSCGGGSASGEREREQGKRRRARESENGAGQRVATFRTSRRRGEDRQAGAVAARRCARAGHTPLASWREVEDDWR